MKDTPQVLVASWDRVKNWPGGRHIFSRLIKFFIPYSGTIGAKIEELEPGHAVVTMNDCRGVRNHLASVHAVALMNLAELCSGLAVVSGFPAGYRGILKEFQIEFIKKARGQLKAECSVPRMTFDGDDTLQVKVETKNALGETVTRARASWVIGPDPKSNGSPPVGSTKKEKKKSRRK